MCWEFIRLWNILQGVKSDVTPTQYKNRNAHGSDKKTYFNKRCNFCGLVTSKKNKHMKQVITIALLVIGYSIGAQSIDYNLSKKGYVAEGYDVVAYFGQSAKKGSKKYSTEHDGVQYLFSSQKNLNTFNETPEKFVPKYGGYCAYAIGAKGIKVDIDPKTFEIRGGELYLFYNSWGNNTLETWLNGATEDLKAKADKNWKKLK